MLRMLLFQVIECVLTHLHVSNFTIFVSGKIWTVFIRNETPHRIHFQLIGIKNVDEFQSLANVDPVTFSSQIVNLKTMKFFEIKV